jgi:hypothetical protein
MFKSVEQAEEYFYSKAWLCAHIGELVCVMLTYAQKAGLV